MSQVPDKQHTNDQIQPPASPKYLSCVLALVVPCFNEEAVLPSSYEKLYKKLHELMNKEIISDKSYLLFVDDGSTDNTWSIIKAFNQANPNDVKAIKFAHNAGHQNAVYAGIEYAYEHEASCSISIDADLQDDINAITEMVLKFQEGYQVVNGVRNDRSTDSFFKRKTAESYYSLMNKMGVHTIPNSADFRLLGHKAMNALLSYPEKNLFLRGLVPEIGFKSCNVYYKRLPRSAGESKYPLHKMISLALDGITSFSVVPIRIISVFGIVSLVVALGMLVYVIVELIMGHSVAGWASMMISMWFFGGLIMISLGIIGEYLARIYLETKNRPRYFIEEELD